MATEICEGQQYDVDFEQKNDVTIDEYLMMIRLKTSVLLANALQIGAYIAGASEEEQQAVYQFGINIGLAFQIQDDILDVWGDPKTFGKAVGGDIACNKKTFVYLEAMRPRGEEAKGEEARSNEELPALWRSLLGPIVTILLLALRPIAGIVIDPMIALPVGGVVGILSTRKWRETATCLSYGLEKMSGIAILLVGTGTLAGIIKASAIKDVLVDMLAHWSNGGTFMAPIAGALMSAATASTTAGATIASASFAEAILAAGVTAVWGAAMTNAGATILDHLPHGSFFHATGGSMGFSVSERLKLIPYETLVGFILTLGSIAMYFIIG